MKKIILITLILIGMSQLMKSQNRLEVNIHDDLCVDAVTVVFTNGSEAEYTLGCAGTYVFEFENLNIQHLVYYGTISPIGQIVEIMTAQKTFTSNTKVVNVGNSIVDDINGLIR